MASHGWRESLRPTRVRGAERPHGEAGPGACSRPPPLAPRLAAGADSERHYGSGLDDDEEEDVLSPLGAGAERSAAASEAATSDASVSEPD